MNPLVSQYVNFIGQVILVFVVTALLIVVISIVYFFLRAMWEAVEDEFYWRKLRRNIERAGKYPDTIYSPEKLDP